VPQSNPEFFGPFAASGGCVAGVCRGGSSCAPLGRRELESCDPRAFALLRPWAEFFGPFGPLGSGGAGTETRPGRPCYVGVARSETRPVLRLLRGRAVMPGISQTQSLGCRGGRIRGGDCGKVLVDRVEKIAAAAR
jgi:hypothetical protein